MNTNNWLKYLIAIAAVLIAGSAAYFSVTGLAVLFSGAAIAVMVMAGSLEFAKLVTATYLKQKWSEIKGINKWYLTSAVVILMTITSAGIFGYLSNAFQQQNIKLQQVQREIDVWNNKIKLTNDQIATLNTQVNSLNDLQKTVGSKSSNTAIKSLDKRDLKTTKLTDKINSLQDSIVAYNGHINDIKNGNINLEKEVGGFRFVAEAFNIPLNTVVKFFIILIVVVFDPLAIALVIAFNQLISESQKKEKLKELDDFVDNGGEPLKLSEEDLKKLEEVILNPPPPNEELKKAAETYNEEVKQKPWINVPDEVWERMKKIEEQREAIHGPVLPEDEPTGALANSGPRERESLVDYGDDVIEIPEREPFGEMMIKEDYSRMDIIGQNGNEGLHYDNVVNDEEVTNVEPTEEEEQQNFSTIEPETENISKENDEDLYWEGDVQIPIGEAVDNEPELTFEDGQLPDDMLQVLNDVETETFSEEPTRLDVPEVNENTTPFVQLPEQTEPSEKTDEEKKNP